MKVAIIGDSQAQGAGAVLQAALAGQGHKVTRLAQHGAGSVEVKALASKLQGQAFDQVVVFSGSTSSAAAIKAIPAMFPGARVVWYGSPPATKILDLGLAKQVFGSKVTGADYWFSSGEAAAREKRNVELPKLLPAGVQYVDWRKLSWPGGAYPAQADGIHVGKSSAAVAFAPGNWPPPAGVSLQGLALPAVLVGVVLWVAHRQGWLRGFW